jgi:crotonobetainyl-CoA:carnitine CoA-transferase CaiB-like acyl-CoA transferase
VLDDLRVLELSAPDTMLAGKTLADLGADVVVVEPPGGADGRRMGPFVDHVPGIEQSLTWQSANTRKRAITLDVHSSDGRELLERLASSSDVVIEAPGPAPAQPVAARLPAHAVHCVIRPFAENGPKSDYVVSDLIVTASSGAIALVGQEGRPPPLTPVPQSGQHAGLDAAIAVLAALAARGKDGAGQRATVSSRLAAMVAAFTQPLVVGSGSTPASRALDRGPIPGTYRCRDGYVLVTIAFGQSFGPKTGRLVAWLNASGHLGADDAARDWASTAAGRDPEHEEAVRGLVRALETACMTLSRSDVEAAAQQWGFLAASVHDMKDVADSRYFDARGLWADLEVTSQAGAGNRTVPAPANFPAYSGYVLPPLRRAPRLGEHNTEVLGDELGLSSSELSALFAHRII